MTAIQDEKLELRYRIRDWMTASYDLHPDANRQMYRDAVHLSTSTLTLTELKKMFSIVTGRNWS